MPYTRAWMYSQSIYDAVIYRVGCCDYCVLSVSKVVHSYLVVALVYVVLCPVLMYSLPC
jgi:hypothetical protein